MPGKERSKEHTWSEKELEKYVKILSEEELIDKLQLKKVGEKSKPSREEQQRVKERTSSSKKPTTEHQSSSTKHHSSSRGAEAAAQKPHDSATDSKHKKVALSSGSGHKTDERDRHRSKEMDRGKGEQHRKDRKPDESSSRHSSKPPKAGDTRTAQSSSKPTSKTTNQSKERKSDKTSSGRAKERSSSKDGKHRDKSKSPARQKIKVTENPPPKMVASSSTSIPSEDLELPVAVQPMIEVTKDDSEVAEEYNYDQEEFDEYEDEDFDSSSGSSDDVKHIKPPSVPTESDRLDLMQVLQAIEAENQQLVVPEVSASPTLYQKSPEDEESPAHKNDESSATPPISSAKLHTSRSLVNFVAAKQQAINRKAAAKTKKRGEELLQLIELDMVVFNMLDIAPLSEYELYMRNFGSEDTRQVSSQTGEDSTGRDTQTDDVAMVNRWVQWPPEDLRGWGCDDGDDNDDVMTTGHNANILLSEKESMGLSKFLQSASQVMCVLLEENTQHYNVKDYQSNITEQLSFSIGCTRIPSTQSFLAGRHINSINFSHSHGNLLLTGFSSHPNTKAQHDGGLQSKGILCVWNIGDLSQPLYVLTSEPHPSCCCFSPHKASLVFAGAEDGSVVLWDLREPVSMHVHKQTNTYTCTPRVPTFSTAGISSSHHSAPVCCITPLPVLTGQARLSDESSMTEDGQGLSFQVASLDQSGRLNIWVIVEINNPDPSGSESDLGLTPGGRVKLVRSASILASSFLPRSSIDGDRDIFTTMAFHPRDVNHCYIGCDEGMVLHTIRYGKRSIPSQYTSELGNVTKVTCISFSPWQPNHFLIGCLDGSIRLHHTHREKPLLCWTRSTNGAAIEWLQWSNHRPAVFLVLDHMSRLWVWDMLSFDSGPTMESDVCGGMSGSKSSVTCCALSHNTTSWKPRLVMAYNDGSSEVHYLNQFLSEAQENEEQRFSDMLNSIIY